jgi:thioredoxin 1
MTELRRRQSVADVIEITDDNFDEQVLQASIPVLVDLWAEWCNPCRMVTPIIEELAEEYEGQIKVGKLDVDTSPATPVRYGVQGIPTVFLFKGGKEAGRIVGARPRAQFVSLIEENLT